MVSLDWSFLRKLLSIPGRGILIRNRLVVVVKVTYLKGAQAFIFDPYKETITPTKFDNRFVCLLLNGYFFTHNPMDCF